MSELNSEFAPAASTEQQAMALYLTHREALFCWTDRLFAGLMVVQWFACVVAACWISPYTWHGFQSTVHPHVWASVSFGAVIAMLPVFLTWRAPGQALTRHVIAVSQMLFGSLLIHLTGGRIETHFHVFGSLAFLAFYRDWRVLLVGTSIVALDHFVRGVWWPLSVFGDADTGAWRWLEHVGWVAFLDLFLIAAAIRSNSELLQLTARQAEMDAIKTAVEATVIERTRELAEAKALADSASEAKSEFLANMSHEIRTPLTAIMGYCELLHDDGIVEHAPPRRLQTIHTIRRAGEHLLTVINDVLDLSKIESGNLQAEQVEMPLPHIFIEIESLMRPRLLSKGVNLRTCLATAIPDRIISDPTRVRQILLNLVGNAVKFTAEGSVTVRVAVDQSKGTPHLRIEVADTGSGMTAEQAEKLFRPFTQGDPSVTRKHGGTGLGLTISRRLALILGGNVWLDYSLPDRGSQFIVELPLVEATNSQLVRDLSTFSMSSQTESIEPTRRLSGKILLAEDSEDNQRLISFHLEKAGATVQIASNGRLALEMIESALAKHEPFDLLLTDMQMPEIDGYTLAKLLRARGHSVPIVALTANAMAEDRRRCLNAGCNDYATKPINKVTLLTICHKWIETSQVSPDGEPRNPKTESPALAQRSTADALLSELADDPEMAELARRYASSLRAKSAQLNDHLTHQQWDQMAQLAHQLKGSGGGYGFPSISDAARRVEACAKSDRNLLQIQDAVRELNDLCQRAVAGALASAPAIDLALIKEQSL